ncbi:MAG: hypothetical protein M3044_13735 [Thermoproteota archaeon]|nr:hypothetical protein [Thermoproteota archaeon]
MGELLLGCSGWNYPDTPDKGGWTGVFYPDKDTKRLRYYSQFFDTAEMDSMQLLLFTDKYFLQRIAAMKTSSTVASNITILCRGIHPSFFHHRMNVDEAY